MKITNREIINALDAMSLLKDRELPVELAFKVFDNHKKLMEAYEPYIKTMNKTQEQYKDNNDKFLEEANKLINIEREIEVKKFTREELLNSEVKLTPAELAGLEVLIDG